MHPLIVALLVLVAIIYFVLPIDLIPDFFLPFGRLDDLALAAYIFYIIRKHQKKAQQKEKASTGYYRKTSHQSRSSAQNENKQENFANSSSDTNLRSR